jgi:hypothetical protein
MFFYVLDLALVASVREIEINCRLVGDYGPSLCDVALPPDELIQLNASVHVCRTPCPPTFFTFACRSLLLNLLLMELCGPPD